ncbi:MAG: hypothetical protein ACO1OB_28720 [Archangium sp.]
MSDRALRDEVERLEKQVKVLRAELASFDVARRVAEESASLSREVVELEQREELAARDVKSLSDQLTQLKGELSQARDSLSDARISVAKVEQAKSPPVLQQLGGCLPVLLLVGASVWWLS